MHPHHHAELAAAVARFLADVRRLARVKLRDHRDQLLATIAPSHVRPAATTGTRPPTRGRKTAPRGRPQAVTAGRSRRSVTAAQQPHKGRPTPPEVPRPSAPRPAATDAAAALPRRTRTPAAVQGACARVAAIEATPATLAISAPPIPVTREEAAPVRATPTTEASPGASVAAPTTDVGRHAGPAPSMHDHNGGQESVRCRGTVKWFSDAKRYGFIRGDDGRDVFVHYSAIANTGRRSLAEGQAVEYEVQQSAKGPHAVSVTPLGASPTRSA
jgi:CspA family cold shock protein